jgi:6-phosphogluconolactonase (cycloisomerase 2 family)
VQGPVTTGAVTNQPFSLALDPTGALAPYLYVGSNDTTSAIEAFAINSSGVLTPVTGTLASSTYPAGDEPFGLAVDSTHGFVYSANVFTPSITGFQITQATGALTALGGNPFGSLAAPYAVAAYPTGQYIYVTDTLALPATAAGTVNEFSYDNTGALTFVQAKTVGIGPESIAIDPAGKFLYVTNTKDGTVSAFTINSANGNLTAVAGNPVTSSAGSTDVPTAAAVDPSSQYLYVANGDAGTISAFTINATTGALAPITGTLASSTFNCVIGGEGPQAIVIE